MQNIQLVEIYNDFWLVEETKNNQPIGIIYRRGDGWLLHTLDRTEYYKTLEEYIRTLGGNEVILQEDVLKDESRTLDGYPIKPEHTLVTLTENPKFTEEEKAEILKLGYPVYTRGTEVIFVAGYWAVLREGDLQWNVVFCPKLETLLKMKHSGPFKSRAEAQQEASILTKRERRG